MFAFIRRWQERRAKKRREYESLIKIVAILKETDPRKVLLELAEIAEDGIEALK